MSPAIVKLGVLLALLALLIFTQLHWGALQVIAWGGMLVTYTARSGIETGIRETFDGDHPCPMCTAIKVAKEHEQGTHHLSALSPPLQWLAVPCPAMAQIIQALCPVDFPGDENNPSSTERHRPPVPPPRSMFT
jgi:hypothetical protein